MAWSCLQSQTATGSSSDHVYKEVAAASANNLLVVTVSMTYTTNAATSFTIADTQTNTWVSLNPLTTNTGGKTTCQSWYCLAKNTNNTGITITGTGGDAAYTWLLFTVDEFSGNATSGTVHDKTHEATGNSTNPSSGATATLSAQNELVWGFGMDSCTAAGSGYTKACDDGGGDYTEYKALTTDTTAQTATFTGSSGQWIAFVATFKSSEAASGTAVPVFMHHLNTLRNQ
jgi:hypothetical protein